MSKHNAPPITEHGIVKEFYGRESDADSAKHEAAELRQQLQSKQITVKVEFKPQDFGLGSLPEAVLLVGGPFDALQLALARGTPEYTRPAANADAGNHYVPAVYRRTKERTSDGLTIFRYLLPAG